MDKKIAKLLTWYHNHHRSLPWRETSDPYYIWLSEVILQQTRVDQGLPYYLKFVEKYPNVQELAFADEQHVYKLWQGLGYYSRAKNMLKAAREIMNSYDGVFPADLKLLQSLPGIGPYTAAAIASMAFNLPHAVVDGNVYRVLSRVFGISTPINSSKAFGEFLQVAESLMPRRTPGVFNQAMMELGALVCKPKNPDCLDCPLSEMCYALAHQQVDQFPVKTSKVKQQTVFYTYYVYTLDEGNLRSVFMKQRPGSGIWANLFDFPCVETKHVLSLDEMMAEGIKREWLGSSGMLIHHVSEEYKHLLTHRIIRAKFIWIQLENPIPDALKKTLLLIEQSSLTEYPVPVLVERYLRDVKLIAK